MFEKRTTPLTEAEFEAAYRALCGELIKLGIRIEGGEPGDDHRSPYFREHLKLTWHSNPAGYSGGYRLEDPKNRYGKIFPIIWSRWS